MSFWGGCCNSGEDNCIGEDEPPLQLSEDALQVAFPRDTDVESHGDKPQTTSELNSEFLERRKSDAESPPSAQSDAEQSDEARSEASSAEGSNFGEETDALTRGPSLKKLLAVKKAGRMLQKAVGNSDGPTQADINRGVHVQNVYDFYDPEARKVRIRKMDETVLHTRVRKTQVSKADADAQSSSSVSDAADAGSESDCSSAGSTASTETKPVKRSVKLDKTTVENAEATANWGHFIGKMLHVKVIDFSTLKDKATRRSRFKTVKLDSKTAQNAPAGLRLAAGRCKVVVDRALRLAKRVGSEKVDVMDHEWSREKLLVDLFGDEYTDTLMVAAGAVSKVLSKQLPLVSASPPCRVFGDLHGQLRDLLLFFHAFGVPGNDDTTFIFNGDFVDRGAHQLEVVGVLLALKVIYPEKVWLIRGNHEERSMNERYGFKDECTRQLGEEFGTKLFGLLQGAFDRLPLACLVSNRALIVHGGIGDGMWGLGDLWNIPRPLTSEDISRKENGWLYNILWSDPIEDGQNADPNTFGVHASPRGIKVSQFSWNITKTFCARNGLGLIIRSHQSKQDSRGFDVMHSNMLLRVFSARDYEGHDNDSAVLSITRRELAPEEIPENDEGQSNLLVVRPQVLRSVAKTRAEAARYGRTTEPSPSAGRRKSSRSASK